MPPQTDKKSPADSKQDALAAALLGLVTFLVYLRTLCPTVYLGDSGEICTAIVYRGVLHPPGYPLFSLLGRAALFLVPFGEPAFRIGCLVALAGAGAVAVTFLLARELGAARPPALAAAALFGFSYSAWSQATRVEVYSLHVLLMGLVLLFSLRYRRTGAFRWLALAALCGTLGAAHHLTVVLAVPTVLLLCAPRWAASPRRYPQFAALAALLLVGPLLYGLLVLWARGDAPFAWGRPVTLDLLWGHASARMYRGLFQLPIGGQFMRGASTAWTLGSDTFPFGLLLVPLAGAAFLWKKNRVATTGLLLFSLVATLFNFGYSIDDIGGYYLPVWLVFAAFTALALDAVWNRAPEAARRPAIAAAVLLLIGAFPLLRNWRACDLSRASWVREFARQKLDHCDPDTVLLTQGDQDRNPIWYARFVLGIRKDVLPIDRTMVLGMYGNYRADSSLWYFHTLRRLGVDAPLIHPRSDAELQALTNDGYLVRLLEGSLKGRPLALTFAADNAGHQQTGAFLQWVQQHYQILPQGLVLGLQPVSRKVELPQLLARNRELWHRVQLPELGEIRTDLELDPRYIVEHYAAMLVNYGGLYEMAGDPASAEKVYRTVAEWAPQSPVAAQALAALRKPAAPAAPARPSS